MATLDLLLPTYRWGPYVRGYLSYLASLVHDDAYDLRLHVGDNSCNPEKHAFLQTLESPRVKLYLHSANIGVHPNLVHLFTHSTGELVQILGDDDWIHPASFASVAFLEQNPEFSSCAGFFAGIPPVRSQGIACFDDRFAVPDAVARSIDYAKYVLEETDINWLALAVHRRSVISVYIDYTNANPFPFYFRDQLLSQIALLSGPVKGIREGFMFYNVRRSEEMPAHVRNFKTGLKEMGLAAWLYEYYDYLLACEYAAVYLYRGVPEAVFSNRVADADLAFATLFKRFEKRYRNAPHAYEKHFARAGIRDPMHSVLHRQSAMVGLRSLAAICARINAGTGERYAGFLRREMVAEVLS
jgi:glycosyl transferase family 2